MDMKYRYLGNSGEKLPAIGLGCMGMSHAYGEPDEAESIATLEKAVEIGVTFWDTADIYGNGKNEELISRVLKENRSKIFLATKFGFRISEAGGYAFEFDGSPAYVKTAVEKSLTRLKTDVIDLYYAHRVDKNVPIEETVGAMSDLVREGKIRYIGLSEASANSLRRACKVHHISALQSEYSLLTRDVETEILPVCLELGITLVPFSPLVRGLVTNRLDINTIGSNDFRKALPRYQKQYEANNMGLVNALSSLAVKKSCTPAQLSLAWVLSQGENIIPIPGTKKRKYLVENAGAVNIQVTEEDKREIDNILKKFPDTGDRYNEGNLKFVDRT